MSAKSGNYERRRKHTTTVTAGDDCSRVGNILSQVISAFQAIRSDVTTCLQADFFSSSTSLQFVVLFHFLLLQYNPTTV